MPKYCKYCGYVKEYKDMDKKIRCPKCFKIMYNTIEPVSYFEGRVENDYPLWQDVVRKKYLKGTVLNQNVIKEIKSNENKTKHNELACLKHSSTCQPQSPIVTCPYCNSTDTVKISGLSKAGSVAFWGIFAMGKVSKQWHCNNCKSDF